METVYSDYYVTVRAEEDELSVEIFQGEDDWMRREDIIKTIKGIIASAQAALDAIEAQDR